MKVRELNGRVQNIRREQQYQREREAEFRDTSELTNSRVVYWTVAQLVVLGVTAFWQLKHLQGFFISKKIVVRGQCVLQLTPRLKVSRNPIRSNISIG